MSGIKIQKFFGKAPRIAPELLPDTAAQIATNVKLYSGDLLPYPDPVIVGNHGLTGTAPRTLHALYDPSTREPVWLAWPTDVDIATPAGTENTTDQRFYYTGDGVPKVSTYALATSGASPYPADHYELGLPLPTQKPTAISAPFTTKGSASYARDASGIVTITTSAPHELKSGAFVTINGFTNLSGTYFQSGTFLSVTIVNHGLSTGASVVLRFTSGGASNGVFTVTVGTANVFTVVATNSASTSGNVQLDITSLNALSAKVTVTSPTTFTYNSPGFELALTTNNTGRIDLAGDTQARSYVYTWFTPWDEESIGSEPSTELFIKEGQVVTVSALPTERPAGKNFIRGIRLYRTLSSVSDTEFLRLATLWFPVPVANVTGTTVTTSQPHNLRVGSYFKISTGVVGGEVTDILDDFRFTYTGGTGSGGTGGILFHDVSENPGTTTARYWGDAANYNFIDDFDFAGLSNALASDDYDPPPASLKGLTLYNNNILVGFTGNELFFSEPGKYHAWPQAYKREVPHNIVGLATFSGYLLVVTEDYPYIVAGTDPAVLTVQRIDAKYPCLSKRSIVNMNYGVLYATHDGLVLYSTSTGPQLATHLLYNSDTWSADLDPSTLIATPYKDAYLAWHSTGGLSFERDDRTGGVFVDLTTPQQPEATWFDPLTNKLHYTSGVLGDVYLWDDLTQPTQRYEWKSKVIVTANPINLGAAQVDADYTGESPVWENVTTLWESLASVWNFEGLVTFRLWVDKELVLTTVLNSRQAFRLPLGYRSDTFEVGVEGTVRLRAIRLAETPSGLRTV